MNTVWLALVFVLLGWFSVQFLVAALALIRSVHRKGRGSLS
jgi:purine-cytosine permease-like protein